MCDDDDDLPQTKSTVSSSISSSSSNKRTSDNLFNNNNNNKTTLDNNSLFDKKSSPNQESSSSSSSRSFKLNRHSSFNDSSISSLRSKKTLSPPSSPIIKQQTNLTSIHISPIYRLNNTKSALDTKHIPLLKRPLFRPDTNNITRISSSLSPRSLYNDKQQHSSTAYVYLRNPSSPLRVIS
jgi:hypothetical protein